MKASALQAPVRSDIDDPLLDRDLARRLRIVLDGKVELFVVAYDVEAGTVIRIAQDEAGNIKLNAARTAPLRELVHGKVEVSVLPPDDLPSQPSGRSCQ